MRTVLIIILSLVLSNMLVAAPATVSGAIFTTNADCSGVNRNIYEAKSAVYLNGGPAHPGAAGLPDGDYYVKVTDPDGSLLGYSTNATVTVVNGEFAHCYQLSSILIKASDQTPGYDTTSNPGGEYKAWVSKDSNFPENLSKTDNFKVRDEVVVPTTAHLNVVKFYDANANGLDDDNQPITGWKVTITGLGHTHIDNTRFTPVSFELDPDLYAITEAMPVESNWRATTPTYVPVGLLAGDNKTVKFGNLALGAGGGLTLGFWSNKNGEATIARGGTATELAYLSSLNLVNGAGAAFDPTTYTQLRNWLLNGTAVNMAYMLSVQSATMQLNVLNGKVTASSMIYAPGTLSANLLGYATVAAVLAESNAATAANPLVLDGNPERAHQEAVKNALDKANNNLNFVLPTPAPFTF